MKLLVSIFWILVLLCAFLFLFQRSLLYPAPKDALPAQLPADLELIPLQEGYGLLLHSPVKQGASPLIVFAHGNAELAIWSVDSMRHFQALGYAVLLLEYPGYGDSAGSPGKDSIQASALQAFDTVVARKEIDSKRVAVYGRSIGGGAAALIAAQRPVAALILESTFSSLSTLVAEKGYPAFLLRDRYDNLKIVRHLSVPVFLYHGSHDDLIPISHSEALKDAAADAVLISVPCGHNDCPPPWRHLDAFLGPIFQTAEP